MDKQDVEKLNKLFEEKGELMSRVEGVEGVKRIWNPEKGNLELNLEKYMVYDFLYSYCFPFLVYKQRILTNQTLLNKSLALINTTIETTQQNFPVVIQQFQKYHDDVPNAIRGMTYMFSTFAQRVRKLQESVEQLSQFNDKMVAYVDNEIKKENLIFQLRGYPLDVTNDVISSDPAFF
ncbi:hypothetical protein EIN_097860 [Entamoeba invadens IP1]|uniref:Uncharacterized protein n=1 Tax=Entamoeba invadens IP1 TaxID=370355 RepID=A0A0A1U0S3_ENTIV|nr:hypothetical protein EIN_097860 [Entamoeba invadens IP1]ELP87499.1 hypothetical protein EIN_097860 [Entamoeba invadens IP1]|eukprot:XP_004254270.1 hypothetical protein EIN_097860 [Entamoeba invadens IP1]